MRLWFCLSFLIVLCLEHFPGTLAAERNVPESEEKTEQFLRDLSEISRLQRVPTGFTPFRGKFHSQSLRGLSEISRLQRRPAGFTPFRGKFHSQSLRGLSETKRLQSTHKIRWHGKHCKPGLLCKK
ncbi:kininogen-1-like [Bombina bombina]|uniref:kininogen-1-like n=1 Tax=Bombina bombina TaxID=8345 RepID=UPI00235ACA6D|nr:kininogen-1-like [Bombina bombina]XP_053575712.1 kininogen-1-like [Bombina bombina]